MITFKRSQLLLVASLAIGSLIWTGFILKPSPDAATELFSPVNKPSASELKADVFAQPKSNNRQFARFNFDFFEDRVIRPYQKGDKDVSFEIQLFAKEASVKLVTTSYRQEKDFYIWTGKVAGKGYSDAAMVFQKDGGFGHFQFGNRSVEFHPMAVNKEMILVFDEVNQTKLAACSIKDSAPGKNVPKDGNEMADYPIDILLIYPAPFNQLCNSPGWGGVFGRIILALHAKYMEIFLNEDYNQAGIDGAIAFRAQMRCNDYEPETGDFTDDLDWLKADAGIAQLRDDLKADIVCMITGSSEVSCGRASSLWSINDQSSRNAFMVVPASCAVSAHSISHELGHILTLKHERAAHPANRHVNCQFGYYIRSAAARNQLDNPDLVNRSIMAIRSQCNAAMPPVDPCPRRIGLFSTGQEERIDGTWYRLGIPCNANANNVNEGPANAVQSINDNAATVSRYR